MFYLILGFFWAFGACAVFALHATQPDLDRFLLIQPFGQTMSLGWLMLVLALFNFVRWYAYRALHAERRARRLAEAANSRRRNGSSSGEQPDPAFVFGENE